MSLATHYTLSYSQRLVSPIRTVTLIGDAPDSTTTASENILKKVMENCDKTGSAQEEA